MSNQSDRPDPEAVRMLAYQLWKQREPFEGDASSDWTRAEEMLSNDATLAQRSPELKAAAPKAAQEKKVDEASKESFPSSDPPASHIPDVPPVNAGAKWAAAKAAERKSPQRR